MVFILSLILLYSCADIKRPDQLDQIEELSSKVSEMLDDYNDLDTILIQEMYSSSLELGLLLESFIGDTLPYDVGIGIDQIHNMGNQSEIVMIELNELREMLELESESINALKSDVKNGYGRRDKYDESIEFEMAKIDTLSIRFNQCQELIKEAQKVYNDLYPGLIVEVKDRLSRKEQLLNIEEE